MRHAFKILAVGLCTFLTSTSTGLCAGLNNNYVIDRTIIKRIETLKEGDGFSSEDFNACQITWTVKKLKKTDQSAQHHPHEITFLFDNKEIIKLVNTKDGDAESTKGLGLNCLEFNDHIYLFFDTSKYDTRKNFKLNDLSYVVYSSDKGASWSKLKSLHDFSNKAKFTLPHNRFRKFVKIFGNKNNHALSIFNVRDETTYLFDPNFNTLKTVAVYNRLTNFDYPTDFHYHKNILYMVRGSCDNVRGRIQCPARSYMETSRDFGRTWQKETLPFLKKSYLLTVNKSLYHFYFRPCSTNWFGLLPAVNRSFICGKIEVKKLSILGEWEKAITILETADELINIYNDDKPILVWKDFRFHKSRTCGYIPLVGCVDPNPFRGPDVIYAGELDMETWTIDESIIEYKN